MKKQLVIGIFLMLVLTGISLMPSVPAPPPQTHLIAGHNTEIGHIFVWYDTNNIYVQYQLYTSWYLLETDTQIGDALSDFPVNKGGNPSPGRFDYKSFFDITDYENDYIEIIPINGFSGTIIISAHAVVYNFETGMIFSAWGAGTRFNIRDKGSFGTYFTYYLPDGDD